MTTQSDDIYVPGSTNFGIERKLALVVLFLIATFCNTYFSNSQTDIVIFSDSITQNIQNNLNSKFHEDNKTSVPNSNEKIQPFCDDLFKTEILDNPGTKRTKRVKYDFRMDKFKLDDLISKTNVTNGCWTPKNCIVRQSVAIVVPYRDRAQHRPSFLYYMHNFLQKQFREYCIVLVEQVDKGQFNRAKLMNVGFDLLVRNVDFPKFTKTRQTENSVGENPDSLTPYFANFTNTENVPDCFIYHDIDLLPEDARNLYGCFGYRSNHLCDKYDAWSYTTQYNPGHTVSSGGIITVPRWQYSKVNGHPNRYWGWGYEDHEGSQRFRSYRPDRDFQIPKNRRRNTDFMNDYILGTTQKGGDIGMVRADIYGYYTQMSHTRGFNNGLAQQRFYQNTDLMERKVGSFKGAGWIAFDGLNTLTYSTKDLVKNESFLHAKVDIRPFQPIHQEFHVDEKRIYEHTFKDELNAECDFVKLEGVYLKNSTSFDSKVSDKNYDKVKKDCTDSGQDGWQCNAFTPEGGHMYPFPLYSLVNNSNIFLSVDNCKDSLGRFQVMPEVKTKYIDKPVVLKFTYTGRYYSLPKKFLGFFRIFYESEVIYSNVDVFGTEILFYGESPSKKRDTLNSTCVGYHRPGSKLEFNIHMKLPVFPPGMYFMVLKVMDFSFQPYLDAYTVVRVRHDDEKVLLGKTGGRQELVKMFGEGLTDDHPKIDWADNIDHEWLDYRVEHVKRAEVKGVKDMK